MPLILLVLFVRLIDSALRVVRNILEDTISYTTTAENMLAEKARVKHNALI